MDLVLELQEELNKLEVSYKELRKSGTNLAQAEKNYKIALRIEILKLRDEGVAVGIIDKICYGIPSIAELRFKRDVADAIYKANQEAINCLKLHIKIIQEQINKEYGKND